MKEDEVREVQAVMDAIDLHPTLREVVRADGLNDRKLTVGLKMIRDKMDLAARDEVLVYDGEKAALWVVPSLRALYRREKPSPGEMDKGPPPAYMPLFYFIEKHLFTFGDAFGDQTDGQFEEVYSNLRRRPDGKSFNALHYYVWQVAAGLLGCWPISAAEYDAIFRRLALSASHFQIGPVSRNYMTTLRLTLGEK
ncbi:MAG: hypothetical protein M1608_13860 [Candidatus Omnitrophica bacterium]|nr:hypothetical protein [Candidatus Omnitrophota bacterium]